MSDARRPDAFVLAWTLSAFVLIAWASISSQGFLAGAKYSVGVKAAQAAGYSRAKEGPPTWMRQLALAANPSLRALRTDGMPGVASSAAQLTSKALSRTSAPRPAAYVGASHSGGARADAPADA